MNSANAITLSTDEVTRFLFAVILLLITSHSVGFIFQRFKMPRVIGEIIGGLLLGPTVLGFFSPSAYTWVFNTSPAEGKLLASIYWLGLVLLMFISGFEMEKKFNKEDGKLTFAILLGGTLVSFIAGWLMPNFYDISHLIGVKHNMLALKLVIGIAVSVTSIPVISKIFLDLNIINTRFAKIILSVATIEDVVLYAMLAIATGIVSTSFSAATIVSTVITILIFFTVALFVVPKFLSFIHTSRLNFVARSSNAGYVLLICFIFAAIANFLNINIVFGALLAGILLKIQLNTDYKKVKIVIKDISLGFFIPLYFAIVGIKLDLIHHFAILFFLGFLIFATIVKTLGTIMAAKLVGTDWFSSLNFGVAMNTRGGPGIVLATVVYDIGIINETFFTTLVLLSIITSLLAGYWFQFVLNHKWKLFRD